MTHAARKLGATAVPLNYRLTPDEAAYVVDNCDAVFVWVDADHAELFAEIRAAHPEGARRRGLRRRRRPGAARRRGAGSSRASDAEPRARRRRGRAP